MSTGARDIDTKAAREVLVKMDPGMWLFTGMDLANESAEIRSHTFVVTANDTWLCQMMNDDDGLNAEGIAFLRNNAAAWLDEIDRLTAHADAAVQAEREAIAALVDGWHIRKGGYTELAHTIRARTPTTPETSTTPPDLTEQGEG